MTKSPYRYVERWVPANGDKERSLRLVPCAVCGEKFFMPTKDAKGQRRPWYCSMTCLNRVRPDYRKKAEAVRKGRWERTQKTTEVTNHHASQDSRDRHVDA